MDTRGLQRSRISIVATLEMCYQKLNDKRDRVLELLADDSVPEFIQKELRKDSMELSAGMKELQRLIKYFSAATITHVVVVK